jgi:hypothetical protein
MQSGRRLENHLTKSLAVVGLLFFTGSAAAQPTPKAMTLSAVIDCIKEAIAAGAVEQDSDVVALACTATKAKSLYNFLGRNIQAEIVHDRNGKFENRKFGNNACYHRIEDSTGKAADEFRCDLIIVVGDALSK